MRSEERFLKPTLRIFLSPQIDLLPERQRKRAIELSSQLETAPSKSWEEINDFIFDLYGLNTYDRQVVKDTLEVAEPFKEARDRANEPPAKAERNQFYVVLQRFLAPSFNVTQETVSIDEVEIAIKTFFLPGIFLLFFRHLFPEL